jgi:hypothetical protein
MHARVAREGIYMAGPGATILLFMASCSPGAPLLQVKLAAEPVLDGVLDEDRATVRNVIYVLHALKLCVSWSVTPKNQGYEVNGTVDCKTNQEIELRDMELIKRVDLLRVNSVCVRVLGGPNPTLSLSVYILRKSEPVVLEEQEIVQIQRKRKFWLGGGAS